MSIKDTTDPEELRRYAEDFNVIAQYLMHMRGARMYASTGGIANIQASAEELAQAQRIWNRQLPWWAKEILIREI